VEVIRMMQELLLAMVLFMALGIGFLFVWKIGSIVDRVRANMPWNTGSGK